MSMQAIQCLRQQLKLLMDIMGVNVSSQSRPAAMHRRLYSKYYSSQTYFYSNKMKEIIKQKRTSINIFYEDVEYLLDLQQNLKRWYHVREFENKMFTFKEYYFYHYDCPRIFLKEVEQAYAKWQDRKRDLVYKKLKLIYNESYSSSTDSHVDEQPSKNYVAVSHFLLEISDYNPYSKKYYLRVEARKEREKKRVLQQKKMHSRRDIQFLNHDLSAMLNDMSQLSAISTLDNSPRHLDKFKNQKYSTLTIKNSQQKYRSVNINKSNSLIKFNFKKKKDSQEKLQELKGTRKISLHENSKQKEGNGRISPKFGSNQIDPNLLKSKSIFSVSSFGVSNRPLDFKSFNSKNQLKINFDSKKLVIEDCKKYDTEKKKQPLQQRNLIIKNKSSSKFDFRQSLQRVKSKQKSTVKLKGEEFSDKKMTDAIQFRKRSMKSEFVNNKKSLINMKPTTLQLDKGKRILQLKN